MVTGSLLLVLIIVSLVLIVVGCSVFKWHPLLVLLGTCFLLGFAVNMPADQLLKTVGDGAGSVFASIGLIIALGTILGEVLEQSGATHSLAKWIIGLSGKKHPGRSMSLLGGTVGIPVFCDSGFIILSNLGRSLAAESKQSFGAISIALATGLYTTHVLIPPTPGPMAAAGNLGVASDLGLVILFGLISAIPAIYIGNKMASRLGRHDLVSHESNIIEDETTKLAPSIKRSITPLLLPVLMITLGSLLPFLPLPERLLGGLKFISHPVIALFIAVLTAFMLLPLNTDLNKLIGKALAQAGPIILITTAGGAFGAVLKATPLAELFETWLNGQTLTPLAFFPMVFLLAAGLKTAQGSSTASLIITSSMIAPLLAVLGMDDSITKALLVITIGGGAMAVSHANDSFFWVIQQYSGLSVKNMYRYFTLTSLYMGISILGITILLALLLSGFMV